MKAKNEASLHFIPRGIFTFIKFECTPILQAATQKVLFKYWQVVMHVNITGRRKTLTKTSSIAYPEKFNCRDQERFSLISV